MSSNRGNPLLPVARFALIPGGGLAPHSDNPQTIIDLVRKATDQSRQPTVAA